MRIRITRGFWTSRLGLALLGAALAVLLIAAGTLTYYYISFGRMLDRRLSGQIFQNTSSVYSAPGHIFVGESIEPGDLQDYLLAAGYQEGNVPGSPGQVTFSGTTMTIRPSQDSYFHGNNSLRVDFARGQIARITQISNGTQRDSAEIEPELITNLFDSAREKRRVVRYQDLPPDLIHCVLASEDKRFFEHGALDMVRVFGAAFYDVRSGRKAQGASTIDMQVARTFFFSTKREWRRKVKEVLMAFEIDQKFSKQQIFGLYANDVYMGNRGSFSIRGFGEAAEAYFGTDVRQLTLSEDAFLASIISAPNRFSAAERHTDRDVEARNRVLGEMVEDGYVTTEEAAAARKEPLRFVGGAVQPSSAPYFVDMVKDHLMDQFSENDLESHSYRIYTTLDPDLERAASQAVQVGMEHVDKLLAHRYAAWKKAGGQVPKPQVALVAMDPHTGEIRALVGGRNYGESQLNHALAHRQPGSVFKPFVYAAAFDNAVENMQPVVTPMTTVDDVPTTFEFDNQEYTPNNYGQEFFGTVTVHDALIHSLNVATVKVAEMVGYQRVVDVARQMGLGSNIQATPAMALGSYEMTPIEVAAGYTAFATDGTRAEPLFIRSVVAEDGSVEESHQPQTKAVLDPRVAYLTTSLMEDVINHGTGYTVREWGFNGPAAGKTGTSHDGWFAGYTSNLLCVVWIGFDDNRDLNLSGSEAAAPLWAEFMKRATLLPQYRGVQDFAPPDGVIAEVVDPQTGELATPACPHTEQEYFIAGSQPTQYCELHGDHLAQSGPGAWLAHLFGKNPNPPAPAEPANPNSPTATTATPSNTMANKVSPGSPAAQGQPSEDDQKKKGLLDKIFGIFGGSKKPADDSKPHP